MEKVPESSNPSNVDAGGSGESSVANHVLKSLNKSSYKISKPPITRPPIPNPNPNPNPNPSPQNPNPNGQSQPPVYNIDKSEFREIVQKLTGWPAHAARPAAPPPPPPPPPPAVQSPPPPPPPSRLHRIRPPPLAHLSAPRAQLVGPAAALFSPLPPLPTVSASAESPITAYMRRLRGGPSPTSAGAAPPPLSPLGFGCVQPSPMTSAATAYGMMLSPRSLLLPTSPRMPAPSPR